MYVIEQAPERVLKIYLKCRGSSGRVFYGLEDVCESLSLDFVEGFVGKNYGDLIKTVTKRKSGFYYDKETRSFGYAQKEEARYDPAEWILRTETGDKITAEDLRTIYWLLRSRRYLPWRDRHGRKASNAYGHWRSPRTTNERRQAFQNVAEGEPPIRARRNKTNLTNAWDDCQTHNDSCWKTQYKKRKRQYRPK